MGNPFAIATNVNTTLKRFSQQLQKGGYLKASDIVPKSTEVDYYFDTPVTLTKTTPKAQCFYTELSDGYMAVDYFCEFTPTAGLTGTDFLLLPPPMAMNPAPINGSYNLYSSRTVCSTMLNGCLVMGVFPTIAIYPVSFVYDASLGVFMELQMALTWSNLKNHQVFASGIVRRI